MSEVDIILEVLKIMLQQKPDSTFIKSINDQYCNRGGLSKKQLEGLYAKAAKVPEVSIARLATLEAIIKKKPTRYKSEKPSNLATPKKDEQTGQLLDAILQKYPQHKRILFLQSKFRNNDPITPAEIAEVQKLATLLLK